MLFACPYTANESLVGIGNSLTMAQTFPVSLGRVVQIDGRSTRTVVK